MLTTNEKVTFDWLDGKLTVDVGRKTVMIKEMSKDDAHSIILQNCDPFFQALVPGRAIQSRNWLILSEEDKTILLNVVSEVESIDYDRDPYHEEVADFNITWRLSFVNDKWQLVVIDGDVTETLDLVEIEKLSFFMNRFSLFLWYDKLKQIGSTVPDQYQTSTSTSISK